jgi:RNA polymerase sigma factor (sigma-70 family)
MDIEEAKSFLEANYQIIQDLIIKVCRKYRKNEDDFSSYVFEKLTANDYKKIRTFKGKASPRTFMTGVISRLAIDFHRTIEGRRKVSEKAKTLGRAAIELEKLVLDDGYSTDQAIVILVENSDYSISKDNAYKIASELKLDKKSTERKEKRSAKNPSTGSLEVLEYISNTKSISPEKVLIKEEILNKKDKIDKLVIKMIEKLTNEERLIIKMKFYSDGKPVSAIARVLNRERNYIDEKIKRIVREFKKNLLSMGFGINDVKDVLDFVSDNQG